MGRIFLSSRGRLGIVLILMNLSSFVLFGANAINKGEPEFSYLLWNLALAWVPFLAALWVERIVQRQSWSSWPALFATAVWLFFLPNAFYMISDFVHLRDVAETDLLFAVALFSSFILNALILGFLSLFIVHRQLISRVGGRTSALLIGSVLVLSSFGIYMGRILRWNTWDTIINPAGVLVDVSERILHPTAHPQAYAFTAGFFLVLASIYSFMWQLSRLCRVHHN